MRNTAFFIAGLLLVLAQEHFFRLLRLLGKLLAVAHIPHGFLLIPGITPALTLPLILFMGVQEFPLLRGASVAFVLGYATDLLGMAPVGLYSFTYVALFITARGAGIRLAAQARWMQVLLTFAFTLVKSAMLLGLLAIFGRDTWVPRTLWKISFPHAISTALFAPLVFHLGARLLAWTAATSKADRGLTVASGTRGERVTTEPR